MSSLRRHDCEMEQDKTELGKDAQHTTEPIVSSVIERFKKKDTLILWKIWSSGEGYAFYKNILNWYIYKS